jgi:hypothetical protein
MHLPKTALGATGLILSEPGRPSLPNILNTPVKLAAVPEQRATSITSRPGTLHAGLLRPYHISAFRSAFDTPNLSLQRRNDNFTNLNLFTYNIVSLP